MELPDLSLLHVDALAGHTFASLVAGAISIF